MASTWVFSTRWTLLILSVEFRRTHGDGFVGRASEYAQWKCWFGGFLALDVDGIRRLCDGSGVGVSFKGVWIGSIACNNFLLICCKQSTASIKQLLGLSRRLRALYSTFSIKRCLCFICWRRRAGMKSKNCWEGIMESRFAVRNKEVVFLQYAERD